MTNRPALLRQIHTEARPYVEQLVELNVVFTGFRKLATDNGLDWGQIKALLRAEIEDGEEGGSEKVDRIIKKAEYAGEYAALLGLGTSNMNERNSVSADLPPHDEDGVIIEHDAQREPTDKTTSPAPVANSPASSQEPCTHGSGAVQDRCESTAPTLSQSVALALPVVTDAPEAPASPMPVAASGAPIPCEANGWAGLEPLPQFDRRRISEAAA